MLWVAAGVVLGAVLVLAGVWAGARSSAGAGAGDTPVVVRTVGPDGTVSVLGG